MKYVVLFTSVGVLSGKRVGDEVTVPNQTDATHLLSLGLIGPVTEPPKAPAKSKAPAKGKKTAKGSTETPSNPPAETPASTPGETPGNPPAETPTDSSKEVKDAPASTSERRNS